MRRGKRLDERSPLAIAYEISVRIMTLGIEMAVMALFGYWLDTRFHMAPVLLIVFVALGMVVFFTSLLAMVKRMEESPGDSEPGDSENDR